MISDLMSTVKTDQTMEQHEQMNTETEKQPKQSNNRTIESFNHSIYVKEFNYIRKRITP
jgi:hypothetical protein